MAEWQRVVNSTLTQYLRKVEQNIMRNRRLSAMVQEKGRVKYNESGKDFERRVEYREQALTPYADMDIVEFARVDRWKTSNLDWRGYSMSDMVTKKERLMNKGDEAIIKIFGEMGERLVENCKRRFGAEYYIDGNASGNLKRMHGIESFMGVGGSVTVVTGFESPTDTFASLTTGLGDYGGTWTGTWPNGTGDSHYDFWSPIIIDYTATGSPFSTGSTWANNCQQVLSVGILAAQRSGGLDGQLDLIMTERTLYQQFLEKIRTSERIVVERGEKSKLVSMGFKDVVNHDGVDITWEFDTPASTAYGFNFDQMETRSLQDKLFGVEGPDWDPNTKAYKLSVDAFLNSWWNPKFFVKWYSYGT